MSSPSGESSDLLDRARHGDADALGSLFSQHRDRLHRMVELRLDRRLHGRLDASDVLQEAYLEMARSLPDYIEHPTTSFFLWLRFITGRKLHALHRRHLGAHARDAGREVSLHQGALPQASSVSLAAQLMGRFTTPSQAAMRAELQIRFQEVLNRLEALDREILALRHFEQLNNLETAEVLGISPTAASNRFVRALERLKQMLKEVPGFNEMAGGG